MAFSVISNFAFNPALCMEYASAKFVENMQMLAKQYGIVRVMDVGQDVNTLLGLGGEMVDMPYFPTIASMVSVRDLTATAAPTDLDLTGATAKAVILRRKAGPVKFTEDVYIRGVSKARAEQEIGYQIGNAAAVEVRERLIAVTIAGLEGITSTPHTLTMRVASGTKQNLTILNIVKLRALLGDAYNRLSVLVMHSAAFYDLTADGITNYKITNVAGAIIAEDFTHPSLMGMKIIVVDSAQLKVAVTDEYGKYRTLAYGVGALGCIYQQRLRIEAERRLDFEAPYWRVLGNFDFAPHIFGLKYTAGANPSNATLATAANWDEAYSDHREVLAAELVHNASETF